MRIKDKIWDDLSSSLAPYLDDVHDNNTGKVTARKLKSVDVCEVELGLYLLSEVMPQAPAKALWVLLIGYPFKIPEMLSLSDEQRRIVGTLRHILLHFKSSRRWQQTLQLYRETNERIRLYDVDEGLESFSSRPISIRPDRIDIYAQIARQPLPYAARKISWATAGSYLCSDGRKRAVVTIPKDLPLPLPPHDYRFSHRPTHPPLRISWKTLLATARWMDIQTKKRGLPPRDWYSTLKRVSLRISPDEESEFLQASELILEQTQHIVGMVSAGKSTLMDVLAVWAALKGYHITLVVGDVMAVFDRVQQFTQLGLKAAPIIGATNRSKHRKRLHRVLASEGSLHPFLQQHPGFNYTSTACMLDGLRRAAKPFQMDPQPCLSLKAVSLEDLDEELEEQNLEEESSRHGKACPFYGVCPYHLAQRDLVDASIWIATPASLVYTTVDPQIHPERMRFLEMVYRRSDIVVVDEVDRVQVQLDELFSPSITLMSRRRESWLGSLSEKVSQELSREGMAQLRYTKVHNWVKNLMGAQSALHSLYDLLLNEPTLSNWIDKEREYFSSLTLLERLAIEVCAIPKDEDASPYDDPRYEQFWSPFAAFLDDPLGERNDHPLADLARQVMAVQDNQARRRLFQWLQKQPHIVLEPDELQDYALRLEFAIMLEVLSDSLDSLIREWKQVEVILGLEGSGVLFHDPPGDYAALLPDAPMGNILGFQYLRSADDLKGPGELRFFRCMGVGRWLLLHLHDFLAADGQAGPHALLLSGTSWAGTSPNYHLQMPVTGVLLAPDEEVAEINKSTFDYKFLRNQEREPISISGKRGYARVQALEEMLDELSREQQVGEIRIPSWLERKRDELPLGRKRVLLLVGSYLEAAQAYRYLAQQREGWDSQVAYLVPDDAEFESEWRSKENSLRRGLVAHFPSTEAWILIAPLLAVERGHNILNKEDKKAAIGAVYFLIRPHPRPDDISYIIHSINSWAVEKHQDENWLASLCQPDPPNLQGVGKGFRSRAFGEWQRLLRTPLRYSSLRETDREALVWSQLVSMWQVIGRLLRGGCAAQVFFCDTRFAPRRAKLEDGDRESTSLIVGILEVLRPYFEANSSKTPREKDLVHILYGPLYRGLVSLERKETDV